MKDYVSVRAALFAFLKANGVTPHIYHRDLPQNPEYPATVYDIISDVTIGHTHDHGVTGFRRARVQLDVFAEDVATVEQAMEKYFNLLAGFKGSLGTSGFKDVSVFDLGSNPDMDFLAQPTLRLIEGRSRDFQILY